MQTVLLPSGWERHMAPAATLFDRLGPSMVWWGIAALLLGGGCLLLASRPRVSVLLALLGSFALGVSTNGLVDDAYIQFRYAANLADGRGPVFNAGERVEGASGGLWIGALALARVATRADAARAGRVLSLLCAAGAVLAAAAFGRAVAGDRGGGTAALLWGALPTSSLYAATGLETAAFALLLWTLGAATARGREGPAGVAGAVAATLRPEGIVLAAAALPLWPRLSRAARAALAGGLLGSALIAGWRCFYYGLPVPRSALVKGVTAASGIGSGLSYLGGALFEWWPLLLALPWIARHARRCGPVVLPAAAWTVLVVARGGDWMPGGRYLMPVAVLLVGSLAAAVADGGAREGATRRLAGAAVFASVAWGLLLLLPLEPPSPLPPGRSWRAMAEHRVQSRWWEAMGAWLRRVAPPTALLAAGPVGALPYASGLRTFDMYGLCSRVAHTRDGDPGHRLWGLREGVDAGAAVVYPGQGVPQVDDWQAVLEGARLHLKDVPDFETRYRPIGVSHAAEYHLDIVRDVVWLPAGAAAPGATAPGTAPPASLIK